MRRLKTWEVAGTVILFGMLVAGVAQAQVWSGRYAVTCNQPGRACTICEGLQVVANIVDFLTKAAYVIAGVMIAVGGFRYLFAGSSPQQVSAAKSTITGGLIGLAITLLAWVIVNTLLGFLTGGSPTPWHQIQCAS